MEKCLKMSAYGFLFLLTFLTSLKPSIQQLKPEYVGNVCPRGKPTYIKNSTYSSNLKTLLSSLSSKENNYFFSTGFQSLSVGENPDVVFRLYLCRGDLSPEVCRDCVSFAVNESISHCQNKETLIYYDECMLRYADRNILLDPVITSGQLMKSQQTVTANQSDQFNKFVFSLINEVAKEAAASLRRFAYKKANYTSSQTVYAMGQCTPEITRENCLTCLQQTIKILPRDTIGARLLWPSCNIRYEPSLFYNETFIQASPSSLQPGKGKKPIVKIIAIVVPLALSALLFLA